MFTYRYLRRKHFKRKIFLLLLRLPNLPLKIGWLSCGVFQREVGLPLLCLPHVSRLRHKHNRGHQWGGHSGRGGDNQGVWKPTMCPASWYVFLAFNVLISAEGKPKVFLLQYCRVGGMEEVARRRGSSGRRRALPPVSDVLVINSTVPGYVSVRNTVRGTWVVQSLGKLPSNSHFIQK